MNPAASSTRQGALSLSSYDCSFPVALSSGPLATFSSVTTMPAASPTVSRSVMPSCFASCAAIHTFCGELSGLLTPYKPTTWSGPSSNSNFMWMSLPATK